jgi:hypothetical protein
MNAVDYTTGTKIKYGDPNLTMCYGVLSVMVPSEAQTLSLTNISGMPFFFLSFVQRWYLLGSLFDVVLCILSCESFVK